MYSVTEKRKYKRIELTKRKDKKIVPPYITRFRVKQHEGQEIFSPDWDIVAVKNLSAGGMVYDYNKDYNKNLELDSLLDLKINFFKFMPSINCIGMVIRIEEPMPNTMSSITVKFTEIDEQEREMINTTVENILRKERNGKNFNLEKLKKMKDTVTRGVTMAETRLEREQAKQEKWEKIRFELAKELEETRLKQEQLKDAELEKARLEREQAKHEELKKIRLELKKAKNAELKKIRLELKKAKNAELKKTRREQEKAKNAERLYIQKW